MGEGKFRQKMESSVMRGQPILPGKQGNKENFTDERSFEVGFKGQVGVFQGKKVGNKQVEV